MNVLAEAINIIVLWHGCFELEELIFKDEHATLCAEEDITGRLSENGKGEGRVVRPGELQIVCYGCGFGIGVHDWIVDVVRFDVVLCEIRGTNVLWCDLDGKSVGRLVLNREIQRCDVCAVREARLAKWLRSCHAQKRSNYLAGKYERGSKAMVIWHNIGRQIARTHSLRIDSHWILNIG